MKIKILQVFYGEDGLPYKDQTRTVHYPITGSGFQNANNTTQIRFYFSKLSGENTTWVAVSKLPNGKIGSKVLETYTDDELNEPYALLELNSFYTQYKGDVFISLQGYQNGVNVNYDEETEIYEIIGTPTIGSTGSIKFTNNYAPAFVGSGEVENITLQEILGYISTKVNIGNVVFVLEDISTEDLSGYENGQLFYDKTTKLYYEKYSVSPYYKKADTNGLLGNKGALPRYVGFDGMYTLSEVHNFIGNRASLIEIDGIEYLAQMSNNANITIYNFKTGELYKYTGVSNYYLGYVFQDENKTTFATLDDLATKRDLITTSTGYDQVYVRDILGNQTAINAASNSKTPNTIVKRKIDGHIYAGDIGDSFGVNDAVNKNYVDVLDSKNVKLTGNQTIEGAKTFTSPVYVPTPNEISGLEAVNRDYLNATIAALGTVFKYRGSRTVAQINALTTMQAGDVYNVSDSGTISGEQVVAGDNIVWNGTQWDKLAGTVDLSGYVQKTQTIAELPLSGNISKSDLVDAITDSELSNESKNPVQNKVITEELEKKANVDGNYPTLTSGLADNLTPYSEESGTAQEQPFINQGTGTGNGASIIDTGSYALVKEKQGNSVVVNQLAKELNGSNYDNYGSTVTYSNGIATFTASAQFGSLYTKSGSTNRIDVVSGHKYLFMITYKLTTGTQGGILFQVRKNDDSGNETSISSENTTTKTNISSIFTATASGKVYVRVIDIRASDWDAIQVSNVSLIDLTQHFGSNDAIQQDLLDHPENFFRYYNGSLAYNTGTLVDSNGQYLECGQSRNVWDEEWELGGIGTTGGLYPTNDAIRSKNYIKVNPNTQYYTKGTNMRICFFDINKVFIDTTYIGNTTFTTPANCFYIRFGCSNAYGRIYNNDITISLYYTTGDGYDQYYPYVQPKVYDTGNEVLKSVGSVRDYKTPDGTIHRNITNIVLDGSVSSGWSKLGNYGSSTRFECSAIVGKPDGAIISNQFVKGGIAKNDKEGIDLHGTTGGLNVQIATSKLATDDVNGLMAYFNQHNLQVNYELAEPTTEQGTPFAENIEINDYSYMAWLGSSNNYVAVPQGCKIFYAVDYKASMDSLIKHTDGDMESIVLDTDLQESEQARDTVDAQLKEALGGTLRQLLAVSKSIDFLNTNVVDLSTLNWVLYTATGHAQFSTTSLVGTIKAPSADNVAANIICTKYKTNSGQNAWNNPIAEGQIAVSHTNAGRIEVQFDSTTMTAEQFKNAMKGVLLAYEKAEE